MKQGLRRAMAVLFSGAVMLSSFACNSKAPDLPNYEKQDFVLFGFWMPYDRTKEGFELYKQSGLNTMMFVNHSVTSWTGEKLHYLGSDATKNSLELCQQTGLDVILNYGYWYKEAVELQSFGKTPFSDYDLYGDYRDIIVGMHIADEPSYDKIKDFADKTVIDDFKSVYNVPYMVNLYPSYAGNNVIGQYGYKQYVQDYADQVLSQFEDNRLLSVDVYPFRASSKEMHSAWLACYKNFAEVAKDTNSKKSYYIQTAAGNEFQSEIGLGEIRIQLNVAMAFGADWFGFYCYEMPRTYLGEGDAYDPMYNYCMLSDDGTPSPLYYAVQSETARISAFSDVYLAYDWVKTVPITPAGAKETYALKLLGNTDFSGTSVESVTADEDTIVGCFAGEQGEAFMVVNYGTPSEKKTSTTTVKFGCDGYAAVYGKSGQPEIVKLKKGELQLEMASGEGRFVTLL